MDNERRLEKGRKIEWRGFEGEKRRAIMIMQSE